MESLTITSGEDIAPKSRKDFKNLRLFEMEKTVKRKNNEGKTIKLGCRSLLFEIYRNAIEKEGHLSLTTHTRSLATVLHCSERTICNYYHKLEAEGFILKRTSNGKRVQLFLWDPLPTEQKNEFHRKKILPLDVHERSGALLKSEQEKDIKTPSVDHLNFKFNFLELQEPKKNNRNQEQKNTLTSSQNLQLTPKDIQINLTSEELRLGKKVLEQIEERLYVGQYQIDSENKHYQYYAVGLIKLFQSEINIQSFEEAQIQLLKLIPNIKKWLEANPGTYLPSPLHYLNPFLSGGFRFSAAIKWQKEYLIKAAEGKIKNTITIMSRSHRKGKSKLNPKELHQKFQALTAPSPSLSKWYHQYKYHLIPNLDVSTCQ